VVCARRASLPEVGGDAALWVEPDDDAGIAEALVRVLADPAARDAMRRAGLARAALFTWDAAARGTLAAFDEAAALGGRPAAAWYRGALRRWLGVGA
jgi:glycosyltransferase involved in cell wall biosynthesis